MLRPEDILRLALSVLKERRLRAILTIIGISIGPAAMVAIIGTVQGYTNVITQTLVSLGENTIVVIPSEQYTLTDNDVRYIRGIRGVAEVTPFYSIQAVFKRGDGKTMRVSLYATDLQVLFSVISSLKLLEGAIPPSAAYASGIVGHDIVFDNKGNKFIDVGDVIVVNIPVVENDRVTMKTKSIRVSGILEKYGNALAVNPDKTIFLPLTAGKSLLGLSEYTGILVAVSDASEVSRVVAELRDHYRELVEIIAFQQIAKAVSNVVDALNFMLFALASSAFIVAITGIMATMFTSILERVREIGVLKAIGFTSRNILVLILAEALVMSIIGGGAGVVAGTIGAHILSGGSLRIGSEIAITASPAITPTLVLGSLGMAIVVGVVGGLLPAYRASRVPPVVALRYE